jgi:hypothetical protein
MGIEESFFKLVGLQARLASLVRQWEQQASSSAVVAPTLAKIIESKPTPLPITSEESNMLSLIVGDALQGVNIAQKYPVFFLRMLENRTLLEDFLDTFDLLQETQTGNLAPLPAPPSRDLSFLRQRDVSLTVQPTPSHGWLITLQQTINHLQTIFFPQTFSASPAFRHGVSLLQDEDNWFTLARQELIVGEAHWTMMLEGKSGDEDGMSLSLDISIIPMEDTDITPDLVAKLHWGAYEDTVELGSRGRATFSPIPLPLVLDETTQSVKADLHVTVEVNAV